jgi:hypothetical protein
MTVAARGEGLKVTENEGMDDGTCGRMRMRHYINNVHCIRVRKMVLSTDLNRWF